MSEPQYPCPHGRPHWGICPWCLSINTNTLYPEAPFAAIGADQADLVLGTTTTMPLPDKEEP